MLISMKANETPINTLRLAAQNAARSGYPKEARAIYSRLLRMIAKAEGDQSGDYRECLAELAVIADNEDLRCTG